MAGGSVSWLGPHGGEKCEETYLAFLPHELKLLAVECALLTAAGLHTFVHRVDATLVRIPSFSSCDCPTC